MRWSRAVVAAVLVAGACGSDEGADRTQAPPTTAPDPRSDESHPFTVAAPPEGYVARSAGLGAQEPGWGEDSFGTDEPYLVLSPDGTPDHPDVVVVALTGYLGYQGGLDQAGSGDPELTEEVEVGGEEARYAPAVAPDDPRARETGAHWADLVVAQGEADVAIRVASPEATFDELAAVVEHVVVPEDRTRPPAMPEPPVGLQVLGAVDAYGVIATQAHVDQQADGGPGPVTAHGVGWLEGGTEAGAHLVVLTMPERSADLDALAVGLRWGAERWGEEVTVRHDGDAVLFEKVDPPEVGEPYVERTVFTTVPDGDVVAASTRGADPLPLDALAELARSVEPADETTWDAFVGEVRGGPGLHADPGRTELMRGMTDDGRGWLLQDQPPGEGNMTIVAGESGWSVDPCLVLTGGERACPAGETDRPGLWSAQGRTEDGLAYTVVATTWPEVDGLFVTTESGTDIVTMVPVPGTDEKAAAVVGVGYVFDPCIEEGQQPPTDPRRIELTAAEVAAVPCPP